MNISEQAVEPNILSNMSGAAQEGATLVGVSVDDSPVKIVTAINAFVSNPSKPLLGRVDNWTDRALPIGTLWGEQLVREFGWEWSAVTFHDHNDSKAVGVFTKDRSLAVYPWHFVFGCLENKATVTILLAFNMLAGGGIPSQEPNGYLNLMEHVHHIVPPDAGGGRRRRLLPILLLGLISLVILFLAASFAVSLFMRHRAFPHGANQSWPTPSRQGSPAAGDPGRSRVGPSTTPRIRLPSRAGSSRDDAAPVPPDATAVEVLWGNRWWPATILKRDGARAFIHYNGWGSASDEWVTPERLRPRQ
jgi:hypothetical protein